MSGELPTDPSPKVSVAAQYDYPHSRMIALSTESDEVGVFLIPHPSGHPSLVTRHSSLGLGPFRLGSVRLRRGLRGAAPVPITFFLLAQEESNQRRKAPRRAAPTSLARRGAPALLARPGGLRNSRTSHGPASSSGVGYQLFRKRQQGSPSARPKPRAGLRVLGGPQGPQDQEPFRRVAPGDLSLVTHHSSPDLWPFRLSTFDLSISPPG